jgi:hypothetical protein
MSTSKQTKVFGKHSLRDCSQPPRRVVFHQGRWRYVPSSLSSAASSSSSITHRRLRTTTSNDISSTDEKYTHRDPICYYDMAAVLIMMLFIMSLFMLSNLTIGFHMLVYEIVMIYVLILTSKLHPFLTMVSLSDSSRITFQNSHIML